MPIKVPIKVLIISEFFAPTQAIASVRWTKLTKYLSLGGDYTIDLLTNEKDYSGQSRLLQSYIYDDTLASDLSFVENIFVVQMPIKAKAALMATTLAMALRKRIKKNTVELSKKSTSKNLGSANEDNVSTLHKIRWKFIDFSDLCMGNTCIPDGIDVMSYDVIVSSFGPKWVHYIGRRFKVMNPSVLWIADYRDPVSSAAYYGASLANQRFAEEVTDLADCITAVSAGVLEQLSLREGRATCVLPNGFDARQVGHKIHSDSFDLVYTGSLYSAPGAVRDIAEIYRSLIRLASTSSVDLSRVRVVYAGQTSDSFIAQARAFPQVTSVDLGLMPHDQALELQVNASILIFLSWNTASQQGVVTGKIFEYMVSGAPVAAYISGEKEGSICTEMIERSEVGVCVEEARIAEDVHRLDDFIASKYSEWDACGHTSVAPNWSYINSFSYANRARQLDALLRCLLQERFETHGCLPEVSAVI